MNQTEVSGEQWSAGIAYIACPNDIERSVYINECYRDNRVSIKMEDGSMVNRVPISIDILNFIDFPLKSNELGTAVAFITEPTHKQPIIVARFQKSDELGDGREKVFQIYRKFNDKLIAITGDANKGTLSINVNSGDKEGKFHINLDNDQDDCAFELEVSGKIDIKTTDGTFFQNHSQFKSVISDTDEEESKPSVISQTRERTLVGNKQIVISGEDISAIHYKGYQIVIDDNGIRIDALDKEVTIQSGNSKVQLNDKGINIEGGKISINGSKGVLYSKIPGTAISHVSQIGVSKKVTVGG